MTDVRTSWTNATTNPYDAILSLISCLNSGYNAWIELQKNGEQEYPIKKKNPELNNPFNWMPSYGIPTNLKELNKIDFFNETAKDLTFNWVDVQGDENAIKIYQETGEIVKGLINFMGKFHPVRKADANKYRRDFIKDNYEYGFWTTIWQPKDGMPHYVVDESIENVFVVCFNDKTPDLKESLKKAANFLLDYANNLK